MAVKKKALAKWEKKFVSVIDKSGSQEVKDILKDINYLLDETSQTSQYGEQEAEEKKKEQLVRVKNLEKQIEYTEEQKQLIKLQPTIRELKNKIKDSKDRLEEANKEDASDDVKTEYKNRIKELEKELEEVSEPLDTIVNGLHRKIKTLINRIDRSVFSGFGSVIRNRREELGYSLKKIEELTGISPSYINRIEKGQRKAPSYRIIEQLAKALDLPVSKLINVAEVEVQEEVPSLEEMLLTSQYTLNGKRVSKQSKEKMVEFIKKIQDASWESDKKYEEFIRFMAYFDYFKEAFSTKK